MMRLFAQLLLLFSFVTAIPAASAAFIDPLEIPAQQGARSDTATLIQVVRTPANRLVAVGRYGMIFFSDDAGGHWQQAKVPVSTDLVSTYFPTPKRGWAVGHGGIVLTTDDAGLTWTVQLDGRKAAALLKAYFEPRAAGGDAEAKRGLDDAQRFIDEGPGRPFLDVWFESETTGYVVGAYNLIFHTTDGGRSWGYLGDRVDNPGALHLNAIRKIAGNLYLTGEQGKLWKLDGAQDKFTLVATPYPGSWFGIVGTPHALVAFGLRGNVWRSGDGGANWVRINCGIDSTVTAGVVLDDGRIALTAMGGEVIVSADEGLTFSRLKMTAAPMPLFGIAALPDKKGVALAGARGVRVNPTP